MPGRRCFYIIPYMPFDLKRFSDKLLISELHL
jgi:hypothetical protein